MWPPAPSSPPAHRIKRERTHWCPLKLLPASGLIWLTPLGLDIPQPSLSLGNQSTWNEDPCERQSWPYIPRTTPPTPTTYPPASSLPSSSTAPSGQRTVTASAASACPNPKVSSRALWLR